MTPIILFVLTLAMAGIAIWLFMYIGKQERQEDILLRLRAGDEAASATSVLSEAAKVHNPVVRWACHLLWRAGAETEPRTVARILLVLAALVPVTLLLFKPITAILIMAAVVIVGMTVLTQRAAKRRAKIVEQMPGFLEGVMRVLAAGNTLEESMAAGARESQEPLKTLFLSVTRQARLGAPIDVALGEAADIHRIRDLRVLSLAANINRKYGGTLRNVFRSLISAIRTREAARRELRALTAETRFSALVLSLLPPAVGVFIYLQNRTYYNDILSTSSGKVIMGIAAGLQLLGMFFIWRMMKSTEDGSE